MTAVSVVAGRCRRVVAGHRARLVQITRFGLIGLSGVAVNTAALALATGFGRLHYVTGAVVATQASTTYNFALTNRFVFADEGHHRFGLLARYTQFLGVNNSLLLLRVPIIVALTTIGLHYLFSNVVSIVVLFVLRFVLADRIIWRRAVSAGPRPTPTRRGSALDG